MPLSRGNQIFDKKGFQQQLLFIEVWPGALVIIPKIVFASFHAKRKGVDTPQEQNTEREREHYSQWPRYYTMA